MIKLNVSTTDSEQRQEYRITTQELIYLDLGISIDAGNFSSIILSTSLDISANGLRVITDCELPEGNIVPTCVLMKNSGRQFSLVSEIKWCRPYGDAGEYLVGLSLFESEGTDIQLWKEMIAELCASEPDNDSLTDF